MKACKRCLRICKLPITVSLYNLYGEEDTQKLCDNTKTKKVIDSDLKKILE